MNPGTLLIRADASIAIGTGHVMRCLALAQAWQDAGGRVVFAMAETTAGIEERLHGGGIQIARVLSSAGTQQDSDQTARLAAKAGAAWIVADGYRFGADYQTRLKSAGYKVLFLDDYGHAGSYSSDLVLNQNPYANEGMYDSRDSATRLLLGSDYCLLRREFSAWREWNREIAAIGRNILITIGGSDPGNLTGLLIKALRRMSGVEAIVVVGGSNPHFDDLAHVAARVSSYVRLQRNAMNMPELMLWADVAIAGAGSTCWELCLLQLPMVLIDIADNQRLIADSMSERGAAIHLGGTSDVTEDFVAQRVNRLLQSRTERTSLSQCSGAMVDGRGTERVLKELIAR